MIEARVDRGRGPVATVLVQRGTLKTGALVVAGAMWGRVRALVDDKGATVSEAPPSMPVELLGFSGAPDAGDRFAVVANEARAREITEYRARQKRERDHARGGPVRTGLADMMSNIKTVGRKEMLIVLKGDVQGSVEAITSALEALGNEEVGARVIHGGAGGIAESDVTLATASKAVILGFNVRANKEARDLAERDGVEIRYYNIIYALVDDVKQAMSGMLAPTRRETMLGNAGDSCRSSRSRKPAKSRAAGSPRATSSAAPRSGSSATMSSFTKASCRRSSASRTRWRSFKPAKNAAWPSRTTRTCAWATSSSASRSKKSSARCNPNDLPAFSGEIGSKQRNANV